MKICTRCGAGWNPGNFEGCPYCAQSALGQQRPRAADDYLRAGFVNAKDLANIQAETASSAFVKGPSVHLGQQQAGQAQLGSAQSVAVQNELTMQRLPLSARYDAVEADNARLRARVAELEANAAYSLETNADAHEHSRELVDKLERAQEGERRKREECERLETALRFKSEAHGRAVDERDAARYELGAIASENARLRRELGRGKQ